MCHCLRQIHFSLRWTSFLVTIFRFSGLSAPHSSSAGNKNASNFDDSCTMIHKYIYICREFNKCVVLETQCKINVCILIATRMRAIRHLHLRMSRSWRHHTKCAWSRMALRTKWISALDNAYSVSWRFDEKNRTSTYDNMTAVLYVEMECFKFQPIYGIFFPNKLRSSFVLFTYSMKQSWLHVFTYAFFLSLFHISENVGQCTE